MPARASSQDYVLTHHGPSDGHRRVEYDLVRLIAWVVRRVPHRWHRTFRRCPNLWLAHWLLRVGHNRSHNGARFERIGRGED